LKASFSTIHPTKHNYYVKVHQFDCFFLISWRSIDKKFSRKAIPF
jgi:hypothetical protein